MEMKFRTTSGAIIGLDPMPEAPVQSALADPDAERGVGQVEATTLLRKEIECVIRKYGADPAQAALAVCVLLDENLNLAEDGYFDDDDTVLKMLLANHQTDD